MFHPSSSCKGVCIRELLRVERPAPSWCFPVRGLVGGSLWEEVDGGDSRQPSGMLRIYAALVRFIPVRGVPCVGRPQDCNDTGAQAPHCNGLSAVGHGVGSQTTQGIPRYRKRCTTAGRCLAGGQARAQWSWTCLIAKAGEGCRLSRGPLGRASRMLAGHERLAAYRVRLLLRLFDILIFPKPCYAHTSSCNQEQFLDGEFPFVFWQVNNTRLWLVQFCYHGLSPSHGDTNVYEPCDVCVSPPEAA